MREVICLDSAFTFVLRVLKQAVHHFFLNNIYMCALWVKCTKATFHMFVVSYNNCYRILHRFPMRCSASGMSAAANVNSCSAVLRKCIIIQSDDQNQPVIQYYNL